MTVREQLAEALKGLIGHQPCAECGVGWFSIGDGCGADGHEHDAARDVNLALACHEAEPDDRPRLIALLKAVREYRKSWPSVYADVEAAIAACEGIE